MSVRPDVLIVSLSYINTHQSNARLPVSFPDASRNIITHESMAPCPVPFPMHQLVRGIGVHVSSDLDFMEADLAGREGLINCR